MKRKLTTAKEELRSHQFWKSVRCEFLVTLLLVFMGCGAWTSPPSDSSEVHIIRVALSFGLSVATLVQCVGHISGAHLNPAVTVAMLATQNISVARALFYILAQCVGGITGAGILYGLTPNDTRGTLGLTQVRPGVPLGQAFGIEFMITFIMVFAVFANVDQRRADMGSRSLSIGLAVVCGHLLAVSKTT